MVPASRQHVALRSHGTFLAFLLYTLLTFTASRASAQTATSSAQWSGQVECKLNVQSAGYAHTETQTWKLTGGAPTLQGAIEVYPANWSVTGQGTTQRTASVQALAASWNSSVPSLNAPMAIFVRASDNRLVIKSFHSQLVANGAVSGTRQVSSPGIAPAQSSLQLAVSEWTLPVIEDAGTSTSVNGSGTVPIAGTQMPLQVAGAAGTASCTWSFSKGAPAGPASAGTVARVPGVQPALLPQNAAANAPPSTGVTSPPRDTLQARVPAANRTVTNSTPANSAQTSGTATSVAPTSNGPAVKQAPEGTGTTAYQNVTGTPASFQISLQAIVAPPTGYGWDDQHEWCNAAGCKMLARGGDTAQLNGEFQTGDEVHVIIGQSGADQGISTAPAAFGLPDAPSAYTTTPAWIYVKRGSQHSNLISFSYAPPMQQLWMPPQTPSLGPTQTIAGFGADPLLVPDGADGPGTIRVEHRGGYFGGAKGDDTVFSGPLNDGWYVVQFAISCQGGTCTDNNGLGGGATLNTPFVPGAINPITVHWWVDANGWSSYTLGKFLMIGPAGTTPYHIN